MNYGIREIEEFKAPSKKPWLVVAIAAVLGLVIWQGVRLVKGRERALVAPVVISNEVPVAAPTNAPVIEVPVEKPVLKPVVSVPTAGSTNRPVSAVPQTPERKPPVDLKTRPEPVAAGGTDGNDVAEAMGLVSKGDRVGARVLLLGMLDRPGLAEEKRAEAERILADVNTALALSPYDMPEKVDHVVERGDSLDKIAKKYGVTVESIKIGNAVSNPDLIKAGDHLRILDVDFSIEVYKERHELVLLINGRFFKRYKVGLGKFDKTPLGTFEIYDRIMHPVWWRPDGKEIPFGDKENILGTHWMAIRATGETPQVKGYGIHGTWDDASIGKSESAGCVRMHNPDVEQLFSLVPLGTKVTIKK